MDLYLIAVGLFLVALIGLAVFLDARNRAKIEIFLEDARARAKKSQAVVEFDPGGRNRASSLTLWIKAPDRGQFEVRKEGAADRLAAGLGLAREARIDDPEFAARYHIDSDEEAFAAAFFAVPGKRRAVEALFAAGCSSMVWGHGRAAAAWINFSPRGKSAAFVDEAAAALSALASGAPEAVAVGPAAARSSGWTEKGFDAGANGAMIAGAVAIFATMNFSQFLPGRPVSGLLTFVDSLRAGAVLSAGGLIAALVMTRGKSWFLKAAGKSLLASALLAFPLAYVGGILANSVLDTAPPEKRSLAVVDKAIIGRKHPEYYAIVEAWHPGYERTARLEVSYSTYERLTPGRTRADLTTRPGRLGREWIVALDFFDP